MQLLVATEDGVEGLEGRDVGALAVAGDEVWAIVDGREVWRRLDDWSLVSTWKGPSLTCIAIAGTDVVVGSAEAHVLRLNRTEGGALALDESFDLLPQRAAWYTPWGGPAAARSIAADDRAVFVNVHVGGVARGEPGQPWRPLVDIDVDVHQIAVAPDGSLLAATGAAGFGRSTDDGATWRWDSDGLHGSYCRAVTVAGDQVLLTASTGPFRTKGAVYRRRLGGQGDWERVTEPVKGNIDTFWLAASGDAVAFVTQDGELWMSDNAGSSWDHVSDLKATPRALAFV